MRKKWSKSITAIVLSIVLMLMVNMVFADETQESTLVTGYNAQTKTFSVHVNVPEAHRQFLTVVIAPQNTDIISADDLENDAIVLKTVRLDSEGKVDFKIVLPSTVTNLPRYKYSIVLNDMVRQSMFLTSAASEFSSYITSVNAGGLDEVKAFVTSISTVIDDGKAKDTNFIASYIFNIKPVVGYTDETLLNAYMVGEGLSYLKENKISAGKFFAEYSHYLDKNYIDEYESLPQETRSILDELLNDETFGNDFEPIYNDNLFIAKYASSKNAPALKSLLLEYFEANSVSIEDYNKIGNDVYKEKVFDELYKSAASKRSIADIIDAFNEEVEIQKDAAKENKGGGFSGGSSGGSSSKGFGGSSKISIMPTETAMLSYTFSDTNTHWAKTYIEKMCSEGVVNGFADGTFKPDNYVTRAEFAKMIAVVLKLDISGNADFDDVSPESWYNGYVAAVSKLDIVKGADGNFMPDKQISRQDAAVMLSRVLEYKGKTYNTTYVGFTDEKNIAEYAKDAVNGMASIGLITGDNNLFMPCDGTTRAQAVALLTRLVDYIK